MFWKRTTKQQLRQPSPRLLFLTTAADGEQKWWNASFSLRATIYFSLVLSWSIHVLLLKRVCAVVGKMHSRQIIALQDHAKVGARFYAKGISSSQRAWGGMHFRSPQYYKRHVIGALCATRPHNDLRRRSPEEKYIFDTDPNLNQFWVSKILRTDNAGGMLQSFL